MIGMKYDKDFCRKIIMILAASFIARISLSLLYLARYGWHTTPVTETYFYYGVANGSLSLSHNDPTHWILRMIGLAFHGETLLYALFFCGVLVSSVTPVLLYLLARNIFGEKAGFAAAFVYAFMMQPLAIGVLLFTHDLVQLPVFILFLYAGLKLQKDMKSFWGLALAVLFLVGMGINPVILLAAMSLLIHYAFHYASGKTGNQAKIYTVTAWSIAIISASFLFAAMSGLVPTVLKGFMTSFPNASEGIFNLLAGEDVPHDMATYLESLTLSADLVPASISSMYVKYNLLFIFVPFGIFSLAKKRNLFPLFLLFVGFCASCIQDRTTRVLDLGIALTVAEAWAFWAKEWNRFLPHSIIATAILAFLTATSGAFMATAFLPLFAAIPMLYILTRYPSRLMLLLCILAFFNSFEMGLLSSPPQVSEAEYEAYNFLEGRSGEYVLVAWDDGFAAQSVARKKAFCSPLNLDNTYQAVLMGESEEEALRIMRENGIDFIVVTSKRFYLEGGRIYTGRFFLDYAPKALDEKEVRKTLLFKMLYKEDSLLHLQSIFERRDSSTGVIVKIFTIKKG